MREQINIRLVIGLALFLALPLVVSTLAFRELATMQAHAQPRRSTLPRTAATTRTQQAAAQQAEAAYQAGVAAYQAHDYIAALQHFDAALATATNAQWRNTRGLTLVQLDRTDDAVAEFRAAIALDPQLAEAHYNLGSAYHDQGDNERAVQAYQAAIRVRPNFALAYNNLGTVFTDLGRSKDALAAFEQAVEHDPTLAAAHLNLGTAYAERGDLDRAVAEFEAATTHASQLPEAWYNLGVVRARQGDRAAARSALERVLVIAPDSEWAARARTYLAQQRP